MLETKVLVWLLVAMGFGLGFVFGHRLGARRAFRLVEQAIKTHLRG